MKHHCLERAKEQKDVANLHELIKDAGEAAPLVRDEPPSSHADDLVFMGVWVGIQSPEGRC